MSQTTTLRGQDLGAKQLLKYLDGEYSLDGSQKADVVFAVNASSLLANLPTVGAAGDLHPIFPNFRAWSYRWRHDPKISLSVVFLTVSYFAGPATSGTIVQEEEADSIAGEEPITSHPNFLQDQTTGGQGIAGEFPLGVTIDPDPASETYGYFTGTPGAGVHFDTFGQNVNADAEDYNANVGRFLFFAPGFKLGGVSAAGLERYYVPRGTFSRSFSTTTKPSLAGVSRVWAPPQGAPALATGYTWLLTRRGYVYQGPVYRVKETYEAGKWNTVIYPFGNDAAEESYSAGVNTLAPNEAGQDGPGDSGTGGGPGSNTDNGIPFNFIDNSVPDPSGIGLQ